MPVPHNVIRIGGSIVGGEVWSCNPRFIGTSGPVTGYAELELWAARVGQNYAGAVLPSALRSALSSAAAVTSIRAEYIDASGRMAQAAEYVLSTPAPGDVAPTKPPTVALVSSLLTGRPGRSYRGRLYWPALGQGIVQTTLRVSATAREALAEAVVDLLSQIEDAAESEGTMSLAVVSQTINEATRVTQISIGDVLDTQRRRRDAYDEQRTTLPYPGT